MLCGETRELETMSLGLSANCWSLRGAGFFRVSGIGFAVEDFDERGIRARHRCSSLGI